MALSRIFPATRRMNFNEMQILVEFETPPFEAVFALSAAIRVKSSNRHSAK